MPSPRWLVALALAGAATQANAQAYQCRVPERVSVPSINPDGAPRTMPVTGYTLALSWAPEFCKPREGQARHATQCSGRNGRFGMVVHGLWPEGRQGWPQWCPTSRRVTAAEARRNLCMSPSAELQARQWAKHGACMTRRPEAYFKATRILWASLQIPDFDLLSRDEALTAGMVRREFLRANPGFRREAVGLKINPRGWLEELRLCYGKDFRPAQCDRRRFGPADGATVRIWRGL